MLGYARLLYTGLLYCAAAAVSAIMTGNKNTRKDAVACYKHTRNYTGSFCVKWNGKHNKLIYVTVLMNNLEVDFRLLVVYNYLEIFKLSSVFQMKTLFYFNCFDSFVIFYTDPDDPYKLTEDTRSLGLVVCRGTSVVLICPSEGMEAIANPFVQQDG